MATKCSKCGCRINTAGYPFKGKTFCRECYAQLSAELAAAEDARQSLYQTITKYFGVTEVPEDVVHAIDRELRQGRTINGLIKTLQYYFDVQGNQPGAPNSVYWIWSDYYEAAKKYQLKINAVVRHNADVEINPEPNIIRYSGESIAPPKPRDFGYKLEDLK